MLTRGASSNGLAAVSTAIQGLFAEAASQSQINPPNLAIWHNYPLAEEMRRLYQVGKAAIGFSPFGVDRSGWNILAEEPWKAHARNFALIELTLSANERREGLKVEPLVCHYWNRRTIC